ncbi:hypothetical protein A33M_3737 [Rhodovulum sp. PH10]|nr:hypothetical protein A33M_3737 [Rhodovulum sp. PH10]
MSHACLFVRLVPRSPRSGRIEGRGGPMVRDALLRSAFTMRP